LVAIGRVVIVFLLVGGGFLIYRNGSIKTNSNKPGGEEKKPAPLKDNPPPNQPSNPPYSPHPQPGPTDSNKTELKVFWSGQLPGHEEYSDY